MVMPYITGDKLVAETIKIRPDMPTILCAGFGEKVDEEKAKDIGVREYIEKPYDRGTLSRLIRNVLDESDQNDLISLAMGQNTGTPNANRAV